MFLPKLASWGSPVPERRNKRGWPHATASTTAYASCKESTRTSMSTVAKHVRGRVRHARLSSCERKPWEWTSSPRKRLCNFCSVYGKYSRDVHGSSSLCKLAFFILFLYKRRFPWKECPSLQQQGHGRGVCACTTYPDGSARATKRFVPYL